MYRVLNPDKIIETIRQLQSRIHERFPTVGLNGVAKELLEVAQSSAQRSAAMGKPHRLLRFVALMLSLLVLGIVGYTLYNVDFQARAYTLPEVVQLMESGINDLIFLAVAIFFLFSYEGRLKRDRALKAVHELRVLAHIVDMHQLTKDPDRLLNPGRDTATSPKLAMNRFELARYLDYCSEMLSLISKVGALYAQNLQDGVVLEAIDAVEDLTTGLSRKIWQKIMILDSFDASQPQAALPQAAPKA